jgi:trigger factor
LNVTREDMPGRQVALTIDLDPDTVNSALDKAYRQMVNQVNIPGFRRGKAPRYMVESYMGRDALTEQAVRNILPDTLQDAIKDQNIEALDLVDWEIISMDPVRVKLVIIQPPKVELGDYGTIRVEKDLQEVTPEQVDEVLMELRREGAPWEEPAEARPIQDGDMVYLDVEGFTTQGPLEEASRENFPTLAGTARAGVPEAVNKALVGMSVGEDKDVTDTLPDDYPTEALRGLDVTYHVIVRSMKEQQLPELDDELAKKLGYDTVGALREAVDRNLRQRAEENAESRQLDTIINQIVEMSSVDVPDVLVNEELDAMLKNLENRVKQQFNITLRQYLTYNGVTEAEWRQANIENARERVVRTQVLQELARREGLAVEASEIDDEVNTMLERFEGDERSQAEKVLGEHEARHDLEDRLFQRKLVERLTGIAEGRIEAARSDETEASASTADADEPAVEEAEEGTTGTASDLEEAGGAAELLGTEGVDIRSENETGEAEGGGTPASAPATGKKSKSS